MTQLISDTVSTCHPGFELNIQCRSRLKMSYTVAQQTDPSLQSVECSLEQMDGWYVLFKHRALSNQNIQDKIWFP